MSGSLLRGHSGAVEDSRVGYVELFFDLVFVFAVTQLSHMLLAHLDWAGTLHVAMLLLAMWWAWIYTGWVTNWLDVERWPVRSLVFLLMAAGLLMSLSIPEAFGRRAPVFVAGYLAAQIVRPLFMLIALRRESIDNKRNFQRILIWALLSAPLWIGGALAPAEARTGWWLAALAVDYAGPIARYWVPRLGGTPIAIWKVSGHHLAERCALFVIIALGESVLITGATFGDVPWSVAGVAGFVSAFISTIAMWWIYFNVGAERGSRRISHDSDPGRLARLAYTYLHIPLIAGIIVTAASDELVLVHPAGHADPAVAATILGGPALYLLGNIAFKRTTTASLSLSHLFGLGLLALAAIVGADAAPVALSLASTAVLILVAACESWAFRGRTAA